ncbi:CopD family protein [Priestia flexa]|uniref:copper resistance D family protein n=1 Tax=Priestia flexa TaxID=86664 RepID=UPI002891E16E|nr:CopD family protein [Priestia flexa]MDT2046405.1 CopD family protein [Priestia flexa]
MPIVLPLFEWLTYISLALLLGTAVLQYVSEENKPILSISSKWLIASALTVGIFSIGPALEIVLAFSKIRGFSDTLQVVLFGSKTGHAWLIVVLCSMLLILTIVVKSHPHIYTLLTIGLVVGVSYAGHAASISPVNGMLSHFLHVLFVGLWSGVILTVSFFIKKPVNWKAFLTWFTPFAIGCFILLSLSGVIAMLIIVGLPNYVNSWSTNYGQGLLLKQISIILLVAFAVINGILLRKVKNSHTFGPTGWLRVEAVTLLIIFFITGVMVNQSPPTNLQHAEANSLLPFIYGQPITLPITFQFTIVGAIFSFLAIFFLAYIFVIFHKKINAWFSLLSGTLFVFSLYIAMITSISF